ncbi:MAG: DNA repair protein RecN, partial [Candidatus Neomarinimicrobiota bacterium]|nr:DNA repair protein RecN [Candidatus Neomarinimicrobiota bacterium]
TLKRKYGGSLEAVLQYRKSIQEELDDLADSGCSEEELIQKIKDLEKKYSSLAITLNSIRTTHAVFLASKVEKAMKTLNMPDARFEIRITQTSNKQGFIALESQSVEAGTNGVDQVEFYLSANPGELVKPLAAIASGGEVSRIMLAIKSVFQNLDPVQTLVFDEIDTGISGKAAESVADQLVNLSNSKQVLCITHLSQIAGRADHHLHITKSSNNGKTKVFAEYLTAQERPQVIRDLFIGSDMVNA